MNRITAKALFKKNIKSVEIGTHSYCNRTCNYCPLSRDDVNRNDSRAIKFMSDDIFIRIIQDLAEINFSGRIDFSRYHEPLSQKENILKRIRCIKKFLPKAGISINTNCDFINRRYLDELIEAGVDNFALMAYLKNGSTEYDPDAVFIKMNQILKKLKINKTVNKEQFQNIEWIKYPVPEIKATIHGRNYWKNGLNRAGAIKSTTDGKTYVRTHPCNSMNAGVFIDYDGSMTLCCDMLGPELHRDWIVGDLAKTPDLFENYGSDWYQTFKKQVNVGDFPKGSPCLTCKRDVRGAQSR